jgi:LDH2 family malate/lactate/ureidoglycolate dehydrogenase
VRQLAPEEAVSLAYSLLRGWGMSDEAARCVAEHLVESDQVGHPSHGLRQLLRYRDLISAGQCDPAASPVVISRRGPVAKIDGRGGLGHPAMRLAVDTAVGLAREFKIGLAGVVRAGHTGRMGAWTEQAAAEGMFAISLLAASDPPFALAAAPEAAPVLRTNPLSIAAPATADPMMLDMAMSVVSESSILVAASRGERVPEGAFVDRSGMPSTDPAEYLDGGVLLPAGGYKGFGLAVMIEALCIALTGADDTGLSPVSGALVICIDSDAFTDRATCERSLDALRERVRSSGHDVPVYAPGDRARLSRERGVITVDNDVLAVLQ